MRPAGIPALSPSSPGRGWRGAARGAEQGLLLAGAAQLSRQALLARPALDEALAQRCCRAYYGRLESGTSASRREPDAGAVRFQLCRKKWLAATGFTRTFSGRRAGVFSLSSLDLTGKALGRGRGERSDSFDCHVAIPAPLRPA